jgi:GT2 family glycosyltransferase
MIETSLYIVIPVHNRKGLTRDCLRSLRHQRFQSFKVIVVDDGSTDGTSMMIEEEFPGVIVLRGHGNLHWTGATNLGIRYALQSARETDYILIQNDDVVLDSDYCGNILNAARIKPGSIIGSVEVLVSDSAVIENGGVAVNWVTAKHRVMHHGEKLSSFGKNYFQEVSILTGRGTLYPVSVFQDVGLFDDKHFKACGDTELPRRAFLNGYRLYVCYNAVVKTTSNDKNSKHINKKSHYVISDLWEYYFDIPSNYRLKYRWYFSRSVSTHPIVCFVFFVFDVVRITYHFMSHLSLKKNEHVV